MKALSPGSEMFNGVPDWKLLMPENCQLPKICRRSPFPDKNGMSYT